MSTTRKPTPAELLDLIAKNAERLRDAGVLRLRIGELECELAPNLAQMTAVAIGEREPQGVEPSHPLDDPTTFGSNSRLPSFIRPPRTSED